MEKTRRRLMIEDMQLRGFAQRTQDAYLKQVTDFARFFNKHPDNLGENEIREYLLYLINEKHASYAVVTQTYCALKFIYVVTMKRPWNAQSLPRMKRPEKLPVVPFQKTPPFWPRRARPLRALPTSPTCKGEIGG